MKNEGVIDPAEEEEIQNDEDDPEDVLLEQVIEEAESEGASDDGALTKVYLIIAIKYIKLKTMCLGGQQ